MDKEHLSKVYIVLKCHLINKMKNKKNILEVRIVPKSNRKFVERGKIGFIVKFIGNVLHNSYEGYSRLAKVDMFLSKFLNILQYFT